MSGQTEADMTIEYGLYTSKKRTNGDIFMEYLTLHTVMHSTNSPCRLVRGDARRGEHSVSTTVLFPFNCALTCKGGVENSWSSFWRSQARESGRTDGRRSLGAKHA